MLQTLTLHNWSECTYNPKHESSLPMLHESIPCMRVFCEFHGFSGGPLAKKIFSSTIFSQRTVKKWLVGPFDELCEDIWLVYTHVWGMRLGNTDELSTKLSYWLVNERVL